MKSIKRFLFSQQTSIFSAATVIMIMIIGSRLLGLVRQRILANFFGPNDLTLFFAAFRLPDLIFEVLIYGTFASAFIPVFTRALKDKDDSVWETASSVMNIGLLIFLILAVIVIIFANQLYGILVPGFGPEHRETIVLLSRILFAAQGFFVISYVLTAVLESSRRFLMPAIAPLFYNLGIILGTVLLSSRMGLLGPVIGVVIGAASHALIQLPNALKLGFRFSFKIKLNSDVKKIGRLSLPRIIEIAFLQVAKSVELFLASLISTAAYTYFTFGNSLQLVPVGLFGTSIAKAALPTLSGQAESKEKFRKTLLNALYQVTFLVLPVATVLLVLRIPLVRLAFGTNLFDWKSTVQTGMVVSAFGVGVIFQVWVSILARGFYALHDTRTPVIISIFSMLLNIILDFILIKGFGMPVWGLAAAFSLAYFIQTLLLFWVMVKRVDEHFSFGLLFPFIKSFVASSCSGLAMYFIIRVLEKFVLDTHYTINLLILTAITIVVGILVYLFISVLFKSRELAYFINFVKRRRIKLAEPPLDKI
jgi:putative peptidoglycan lipid II flippase